VKHLSTITTEFLKRATVPDWWKLLSLRQQREYLRTHPHSELRLTYPSKVINDVKVGKIDRRNIEGTSLVGYLNGLTRQEIEAVFGHPNAFTQEYGEEWVVRMGPQIATLYGQHGQEKNRWHLGGNHGMKNYLIPLVQKVFPNANFLTRYQI